MRFVLKHKTTDNYVKTGSDDVKAISSASVFTTSTAELNDKLIFTPAIHIHNIGDYEPVALTASEAT